MRGILRYTVIVTTLSAGVPPRASSVDYPVRGNAKIATIGAVLVPPDQVSKMFSAGISKQYIVLEVAIYPEDGQTFDVASSDFALKIGSQINRAEKPSDVAPWPDKHAVPGRVPVDVTTETGVVYSRTSDPVNGTRQSVGTYNGVSVSGGGPPQPDPPRPRVPEERISGKALPEGETRTPVAGYLYFPRNNKKSKSDTVVLKYSNDAVSVNLVLPR